MEERELYQLKKIIPLEVMKPDFNRKGKYFLGDVYKFCLDREYAGPDNKDYYFNVTHYGLNNSIYPNNILVRNYLIQIFLRLNSRHRRGSWYRCSFVINKDKYICRGLAEDDFFFFFSVNSRTLRNLFVCNSCRQEVEFSEDFKEGEIRKYTLKNIEADVIEYAGSYVLRGGNTKLSNKIGNFKKDENQVSEFCTGVDLFKKNIIKNKYTSSIGFECSIIDEWKHHIEGLTWEDERIGVAQFSIYKDEDEKILYDNIELVYLDLLYRVVKGNEIFYLVNTFGGLFFERKKWDKDRMLKELKEVNYQLTKRMGENKDNKNVKIEDLLEKQKRIMDDLKKEK